MSDLMTLKEFVRRLEPLSRENPDTLKRQVRFWTEVEAIPVASLVSTGSGKMRLYDEDSLLYASVAIEMAAWGVTIGFIKTVLRDLAGYIRGKAPQIEQARGGYWEIRLVITMSGIVGGAHVNIFDGQDAADRVKSADLGAPCSSTFVINLTRLWAKLR
jgi:hypothetical protein